jgi:hypothetical protein
MFDDFVESFRRADPFGPEGSLNLVSDAVRGRIGPGSPSITRENIGNLIS